MKSLLRFFGKAQATSEESAPWFSELYFELLDYTGNHPFTEVIDPWREKAEQAIQPLKHYKQIHFPPYPYEVKDEDLWRWYGLSRVNDYLLFGFQARPDFYRAPSRQSEKWLSWMKYTGHRRLIDQPVTAVESSEYLEFFSSLGFTTLAEAPYKPFFHEIVEVVESPEQSEPIVIDHVYWPGLMFGDMLFSRAGVRVRSLPGVLDKEVAENSRLYFTFWRARRETEDLSHGWGSNSQWRTRFRRDYRGDNVFHYNVDGKYWLDESYYDSMPDDLPPRGDGLTLLDERIELLTNRCLVRCRKDDHDLWPFDDKFDEPTTSFTT